MVRDKVKVESLCQEHLLASLPAIHGCSVQMLGQRRGKARVVDDLRISMDHGISVCVCVLERASSFHCF